MTTYQIGFFSSSRRTSFIKKKVAKLRPQYMTHPDGRQDQNVRPPLYYVPTLVMIYGTALLGAATIQPVRLLSDARTDQYPLDQYGVNQRL